MADEEKKIIVDDDWKQQAQKEKEQLKQQQEEKAAEETKPEEGQRPPLPPANFAIHVSMLAQQVFFALGLIVTEPDKEPQTDLDMAKFNIDMLAVLEEKTKGNLSDEESKMLTETLAQLRMAYVEISKKA